MKFVKFSSILLLSLFAFCAFIPEASARHHRRCCKGGRSAFGLSFNIGGPSYAVAPAPAPVVVAPVAPVAPVAMYPARAVVAAPVYPCPYYYAPAPVVAPAAYVQPGISYTYWRY